MVKIPPLMPCKEFCSMQGHSSADNNSLSVSVLGAEACFAFPPVKDYRSALSHVFSLADTDLAASRISRRMLSSFEKSYPHKEIKLPYWYLCLVLKSLWSL